MTEYAPAKTGEYLNDIPQFSKLPLLQKYLKDNKHDSLHLMQKCARTFVLGHYHSFPWATLLESCLLLGTDSKYPSIFFVPNGGYCLCTWHRSWSRWWFPLVASLILQPWISMHSSLIIACDFLVTVGYSSQTAHGLEPKEACYKIKWR